MKLLSLEMRQERKNLDVWPLSVENEALSTLSTFHLKVVLIYLKTCANDRGDSSARLVERILFYVSRRSCERFCKHFGLL